MWQLTLRNLRANLTRLVATAVAVITGTAFVAAGLVLTEAIRDAAAGSVEDQYGAVDAAVSPAAGSEDRGFGGGGVDAGLLDVLVDVPGVDAAAGDIAQSVELLDAEGDAVRSQTLGRVWITDEELNATTVADGSAPGAAGEIAVDRETAEAAGAAIGDEFDLATPAGTATATVVGITEFGSAASADGGGTVFFSAEEGPTLLSAGPAQYDHLLFGTDGPPGELVEALEAAAPPSVVVVSGAQFREDRASTTESFVSFLRPVLLGFSLLALFVAGFVIYNTFSVVVSQRTRELALVRSIGGTPSQVRRSLLGEGLLLGFGASVVGLVVGVLLSLLLNWVLGRFDLTVPGTGFALTPMIVVVTLVAGTSITVAAVMVPAFRAGRTAPVQAMRSVAVDDSGSSTGRMVVGGAFLVLGLSALVVHVAFGTTAILLGVGSLLFFLGVVVGGPLIARLFGRVVQVPLRGTLTGRLAADNMVRNPRRTATTANALVVGLFLVSLVTVAGTAFRDWTTAELAKITASDFLVVGAPGVPEDLVEGITGVEGVTDTAPVRSTTLGEPDGTTTTLSGGDVEELRTSAGLEASVGSLEAVAEGRGAAVLGSGSLGGDTGAGPGPGVGGSLTVLDASGSPVEVPVVAELEVGLDTLFLSTLVSDELFDELAGDQPTAMVFVRADQDRIDRVGEDLDALLEGYTGVDALPGNFIGQILSTVIDFMIAAVNGLLALSVLIALIGIVNTMNLSIHERRRELGMVRALGMTRAQVKAMVRTEAVLMGVLGTVVGVGSGLLLGVVVSASITDAVPSIGWARVGLVLLAGVAISVLASLLPARRAVRLEMLDAMAAT